MSRISLLVHKTQGKACGWVLITMISLSACGMTGLYPTAFDYKQQEKKPATLMTFYMP